MRICWRGLIPIRPLCFVALTILVRCRLVVLLLLVMLLPRLLVSIWTRREVIIVCMSISI